MDFLKTELPASNGGLSPFVAAVPMLDDAFLRHLPHWLADGLASLLCLAGSLPALVELAETLVDYGWYGAAFTLHWLPGAHGLSRRCMARALRLDAPPFSIKVVPVETATVDGGRHTLRGTLWLPSGARAPPGPFPVVIIRTPYGQKAHVELGQGLLAERGYAVLYQDTRGRFGSDGEFVPVDHERADGAATVRWVRAQPWCNGRVAVFGFSYLGFTAWACVGAALPGELQAAIPVITQSRVHSAAFVQGGALSLELLLLWLFLVMRVLGSHSPLGQARAWLDGWRGRIISRAQMHTPLSSVDVLLLGRRVNFIRHALAQPTADGPFWAARDKLCDIAAVGRSGSLPPIHIITGWHDFFKDESLRDFELVAAAAAARPGGARLTVGVHDHWGVLHLPHLQHAYRCILACLDTHLSPARPLARGAPAAGADSADGADGCGPPFARALPMAHGFSSKRQGHGAPGRVRGLADELALPVQLCLLGSGRWKGYARWPPAEPREERLWLTAARRLSNHPPHQPHPAPGACARGAPCLCYEYDPSRPTPAAGGPAFNPLNSGARSQRAVERRADVLVFTSEPLRRPLVVVGHVRLALRLASSAHSVDLVARLCEVRPLGGSTNICEGIARLHAPPPPQPPPSRAAHRLGGDEGTVVTVELGPIGAELRAGSRVRLHVCSGAHPRWMRNLNNPRATPLADHTCGEPSTQRVWVDCADSFLVLPIDS